MMSGIPPAHSPETDSVIVKKWRQVQFYAEFFFGSVGEESFFQLLYMRHTKMGPYKKKRCCERHSFVG